jgi:hypothetical protein
MPIEFEIEDVKDDCNIYFETGLWNVDAEETSLCKALTKNFNKCCSVEINKNFIDIATNKFQIEIDNDKLKLFEGDSKNLKNYLNELNLSKDDKILFFLDSHGSGHGCPLVEELDAISSLERKDHTILIDDVRIIRSCVWGDNRYDSKTFENILKQKLLDINPNYQFSYLKGYQDNDVLMARV